MVISTVLSCKMSYPEVSFTAYLSKLEGYLHQIYVALDADMDPDSADIVIIKCDRYIDVNGWDKILNGLDILHNNVEEIIALLPTEISSRCIVRSQLPQPRGQPKLKITKVSSSANFTRNDIAAFLKCSSKTISRWIQEYNLITYQYLQITDNDLDQVTLAGFLMQARKVLWSKESMFCSKKSVTAFCE